MRQNREAGNTVSEKGTWERSRETVSTYDDDNHAECVLTACKVRREQEDDNRHRDGSKSQSEFHVCLAGHDDHELDGKSKKEEKVKLQESYVDLCQVSFTDRCYVDEETTDLIRQISALHSQVSTDMLVDSPRKFVI